MKSVYIGVPAYGPIDPAFMRAVCTALLVCREAGIAVELDLVGGCSLIAKARNEITDRFLASDFDCLFFIDADIEFNAADFIRLASLEEEIVGGPYRTKEKTLRYTFEPVTPLQWENGLLKVSRIGTGFLRIKRSAFEKMSPPTCDGIGAYFNCGIRDGQYWGEDYSFCSDWGGDIWMYPCDLKHCGRYEYTGSLDEWLWQQQMT